MHHESVLFVDDRVVSRADLKDTHRSRGQGLRSVVEVNVRAKCHEHVRARDVLQWRRHETKWSFFTCALAQQ